MESQQISTPTENQTSSQIQPVEKPLSDAQLEYIDFCSIQGLVTLEDGSTRIMTATEFAKRHGVDRTTLYYWQKSIPNFWMKVQDRRKELGSNTRIMKVYNGLYLKAAMGDSKAAALWLANHDPDFRMPTQKLEHGIDGGLADMLNVARERKQKQSQILEGEVIDGKTDNP